MAGNDFTVSVIAFLRTSMSSLKTLPASRVPPHVVRGGILDDSWGEECDRGCVVAGEDLDSPAFISRINNIVSTDNRTFDSRQNLQNRRRRRKNPAAAALWGWRVPLGAGKFWI